MSQSELEKKVNTIYDTLIGVNGNPGLLKKYDDLASSHYTLRNRFYMMAAFLVGSGALAGWSLINGLIP